MEWEAADIAGNSEPRGTTAASPRDRVLTAATQRREAKRSGRGGERDEIGQKHRFAARQVSTLSVSHDI